MKSLEYELEYGSNAIEIEVESVFSSVFNERTNFFIKDKEVSGQHRFKQDE